MKTLLIVSGAVAALLALACDNTSGLSNAPRATFSELACLDINGDNVLSGADAANASKLPDFNADRSRDADDAAYLYGLNVALDPNRDKSRCEGKSKRQPEYLVAHGYLDPSDVSCDGGDQAVLLIGVGGGVVNLKNEDQAAGVRSIVDELQQKFDDADVQTIGVISGQAIAGATNPNAAMEDWLSHATRVYLQRFPCLRVVLVGHSHGGVTVNVVAARLEPDFGDRFVAVVEVDRVEELYIGDLQARPDRVPLLVVYETNDPAFKGGPAEGANVENWDASAEPGGSENKPVTHTTIDNSKSVRARIVEEVMERAEGANATQE